MANKARLLRRRAMEQYTLDQMDYLEAKRAKNLSPKTLLNARSNFTNFCAIWNNKAIRCVCLT